MRLPWIIYKENKELKAKLETLLVKSEQLLSEKNKAIEELKKVEEWKNNPFALLNHYNIPISVMDLTKLSAQEQLDYARKIHDVFANEAYQQEMEAFALDIRENILSNTEDHKTTERNRQILIFIAGIANRFRQLSTLYLQNQNNQKENNDSTSVIG